MAVSAATTLRRPRALAAARAPAAVPVALGLLAAVSVLVRTARFDVGFWIDEGLSVGISDRPLADIPGVLRQDGSPPLYYLLLHGWIRLLGDTGEEATHALSLLFATLAIPVSWVLVRGLFGARAAWAAAVLVALNPFLTQYAQETRMYALVVLLAIVSVGAFLGTFAQGRGRRWTVGFATALAALLYTHNWGLFLTAGLAAAWAVLAALGGREERRRLLREGLVAAAIVGVLYAAWVPTLLFQAAHTGAPWANPPDLLDLVRAPGRLFGAATQYVLLVGLIAGLSALRPPGRGDLPPALRAAAALGVVVAVTLTVPWIFSQVFPAWATRYLAVLVAPLLLLVAIALSGAGRVGVVVVTLAALLGVASNGPGQKSNVRQVVEGIAPSLRRGDLVVATQPELAPVAHEYLQRQGVGGLRWATVWGPLEDPGVTDWRDGTDRLRASRPERDLAPLLDDVPPGGRVLLLGPDVVYRERWRAPWTALVRRRSTAWEAWMRNDRRFRVVDEQPTTGQPPRSHPVRALILVREPIG